MSETVKAVAARLGITPAELERRMDEARAAITRRTASLSFGGDEPDKAATPLPPGYSPDSHELRFPDKHAKAMGETEPVWVKPGKGRHGETGPLLAAVEAEEKRRLALIGANRRRPAAVKASAAAAASRAEKAAAVRAEVDRMTKEGKRPHTIAHALGITARRVKQIQADARKSEITAAEK